MQGFFLFPPPRTRYHIAMTNDLLTILRCPIDPQRAATLVRDELGLRCDACGVHYPLKNGIPILIADDAILPDGVDKIGQLPCCKK
jgi:uncharacterized protein